MVDKEGRVKLWNSVVTKTMKMKYVGRNSGKVAEKNESHLPTYSPILGVSVRSLFWSALRIESDFKFPIPSGKTSKLF